MDDLSRFCCQNQECRDYGKRGAGNVVFREWYGSPKRRHKRLLCCRTCRKRFSERKGTIFFRAHLPEEKVVEVVDHVQEGCGLRKTARLTEVNRNTVGRYSELAGTHGKAVHDELAAFSPSDGRSTDGRKMGVRGPKGETLRSRRPRRCQAR
jgi:LacI family transcriptional regulator